MADFYLKKQSKLIALNISFISRSRLARKNNESQAQQQHQQHQEQQPLHQQQHQQISSPQSPIANK